MWFFSKRYFPFWAVFAALLTTACNKDEVILDDRDHAPVITLDSESGVYTVKMGRELTIAPTVEYAEGATYSWIVDGKLAGSEPTYTAVFTELGEVYITFRVETAAGKAEAELRVDVLELTPPVISLALPAEGLKVLPGVEYTFTPDIQHSDQEDFRCRWLCAGEVVSTQMSYTFREEAVGSYPIRIEASNDDGTSFKEFVVEVVEKMPSEVRFEKLSHYCKTTDRSTFVGRAVYLAPSLAYIADPQFVWSVDGEPVVAETGAVFKFTPDGPGDYTVRVDVTEGGDASERLTRNIVRGVATLSAEIVVHAFADEEQRLENFGYRAMAVVVIQPNHECTSFLQTLPSYKKAALAGNLACSLAPTASFAAMRDSMTERSATRRSRKRQLQLAGRQRVTRRASARGTTCILKWIAVRKTLSRFEEAPPTAVE